MATNVYEVTKSEHTTIRLRARNRAEVDKLLEEALSFDDAGEWVDGYYECEYYRVEADGERVEVETQEDEDDYEDLLRMEDEAAQEGDEDD